MTEESPEPEQREAGSEEMDPAEEIGRISTWERLKDNWAKYLITAGSLFIIVSIVLIFVYLGKEAYPLFLDGELGEATQMDLRQLRPSNGVVDADEYLNLAFRVSDSGQIQFTALKDTQPEIDPVQISGLNGSKVTAVELSQQGERMAVGTDDGRAAVVDVNWQSRLTKDGIRKSSAPFETTANYQLDPDLNELKQIEVTGPDENWVVGLTTDHRVVGVTKGGLFGGSKQISFNGLFDKRPTAISVARDGSRLYVVTGQRTLNVVELAEDPSVMASYQHPAKVTAQNLLIGSKSWLIGDANGNLTRYLLLRQIEATNGTDRNIRLAGKTLEPGDSTVVVDRNYADQFQTQDAVEFAQAGHKLKGVKRLPGTPEPVAAIYPSPISRTFFAADTAGNFTMSHGTSGKLLARKNLLDSMPRAGRIAPEENALLLLTAEADLQLRDMNPGHPEATLETLFSKVWYEGYNQPSYVWQSTGATDSYESKFSIWPLIFGTFKGAFYAMIFALPLAVFGALYLSQMAPQWLRDTLKPIIELMAALPTVIVGFLGGLWLAPVMDRNLPGVLLAIPAVPLTILVVILLIKLIPYRYRRHISDGWELVPVAVFSVIAVAATFKFAPVLENVMFQGDLQMWLYQQMGVGYDTRNALVVGIAMGFAVIPIIFSISEDAMSSVPETMRNASHALGSTRWQTAWNVVVPAAAPGLFAAVMLGFGRAVGETMIVLMATGNTPVLDMSIFNGFRTMSANIAVEIAEAPVGGTLYRTLFLTGLLLFIFTFVINLIANRTAAHLREKYGRF